MSAVTGSEMMIKKIYSSKKFYNKKHMKSATAILRGTHGVVRLNYELTTVSKLGPQLITLYLGLAGIVYICFSFIF